MELAKQLGNVALGAENRITSFIEKPENPTSTLAATMVYALKKEHLHYIPSLYREGQEKNMGEIKAGELIAYIMQYEHVYGHTLK